MNVAGPSRAGSGPSSGARGRVESTYEADLLRLLSQLDLDEMDEMQTYFTHRTRAGDPLSDHDVAMSDLLVQARALAVFDQDRALAQRIAVGEEDDGELWSVQPAPAVPDRALAQRIADGEEDDGGLWSVQPPPAAPRPNGSGTATLLNANQRVRQPAARNGNTESQTWGGWLTGMVGWVMGIPLSSESGSSTSAQKKTVTNRPTGHNCIICQDPIYGAEVLAPCGHYYGIDCITDLVQSATKDETLFPPRCCRQNIPFTQIQPHLSQALVSTFQQKQAEFSTLKRVYCSSPTCSRFLGPLVEGVFSRVFTCPAPGCGRRTCGRCREQHSGDWTHTCRPDADATQVLELGRTAGWARCPGCSQLIELHIGCFHMTCRCRTEFCYLCRARWKTCACPQWDERRLMVAAEERVDARLGVQRNVPVPVPVNRIAARPAAPVPVPIQAQRPAQARPMGLVQPAQPRVPAAPPAPAPARPPPVVNWNHHTPAVRTQTATATATSSTARPANVASTSTTGTTTPGVDNWRSRVASASKAPTSAGTGTSTSGSTSGWRSTAASTSGSALASGSGSGSRSTLASTSASTSSPTTAPKSTPTTTWRSASASTPKSSTATADPTRQRLVREMMDRLRYDHECEHKRWRYRNGGGVCQSCGHHLPLYLYRCHGCEMLACNRCRRNRL